MTISEGPVTFDTDVLAVRVLCKKGCDKGTNHHLATLHLEAAKMEMFVCLVFLICEVDGCSDCV